MQRVYLIVTGLLVLLALFGSCRRDDDFITDNTADLRFCEDTVLFDTVFTTVGSTTEWLKVYNRFNKPIQIASISLANGNSSNYRINVDGVSGRVFSDIEIPAEDSIFIFVEVTVDPNGGTTPLIITDNLVFETNGNVQEIELVAWGQDAYFYPNVLFGDEQVYQLPSDKPNVFYGLAIIDSNSRLIIPEGTQLHFHKGAGIVAGRASTLEVNGTAANPVVFQGDRLEEEWQDVPGQWGVIFGGAPRGGIWLTATSRDHVINHAVIKNSDIGIQVDSVGSLSSPTLTMESVTVINNSGVGLLAQGAWVEAKNCVFANAGNYVVALNIGGVKYLFEHCTFANYWRFGSRNTGMLLLNNFFKIRDDVFIRDLNNTVFSNCIIEGSASEELETQNDAAGAFDYFFDRCILRTEKATTNANRFADIIRNPGTQVFADPLEGDFRLYVNSPAVDEGKLINVLLDIEGNTRDGQPDLGAYEFIP
ncbi:MAG: right-handed parallel beta-helix repeat-containing protein [Salibacteraceae bacterium]